MSVYVRGRSGRFLMVSAAVVATAAMLTGCATPAETAADGGDSDWVTITTSGQFGDAVIEAQPERVFALSATDADILLSIGVAPIAVPSMPQTDAATGGTSIYPWQEELYPSGTPKVEASTTELNIEGIAATNPDLIIGTSFFGLTEETYAELEKIAPVVHFDAGANADGWQASTLKIAEAVGRTAEAQEAITAAEAVSSQIRDEFPELEGTTYNAVISPSPDGVWILCSEEDNLGRVMADFGMLLSDYAQTVECDGGKAELSWENVPELDADVLWAIPDNAEQMSELTGQTLWTSLPAVTRDAVVVVPKTEGIPFALGFPSPLSLTWAANQLAPQFAEAAGK